MHIKFILLLYNIGHFALFATYTVPVRIDDLAEIDYSLNSLEVFRPYIDMALKVTAVVLFARIARDKRQEKNEYLICKSWVMSLMLQKIM